jgi:hypothetical protein
MKFNPAQLKGGSKWPPFVFGTTVNACRGRDLYHDRGRDHDLYGPLVGDANSSIPAGGRGLADCIPHSYSGVPRSSAGSKLLRHHSSDGSHCSTDRMFDSDVPRTL